MIITLQLTSHFHNGAELCDYLYQIDKIIVKYRLLNFEYLPQREFASVI